jgi:hypothetical protein
MLDPQTLMSGVGLGAAAVAVYVKFSLPKYTVEVLNGRYTTKELIESKFAAVDKRFDDLKELIEAKLDGLPCVNCHHK